MATTRNAAATDNEVGSAVFRYLMADYLNVGTVDTPDFRLMNTFETIDENPNAEAVEKTYTGNRSATTLTAGYKPQFPITGDMYKDNRVMEFLRDIGEEQKVGVVTEYIRVRLYQPIESKQNTYYARLFKVSPEISGIEGAGGEVVSINGNLNQVGDLTIGEFNTVTRAFSLPSIGGGTAT